MEELITTTRLSFIVDLLIAFLFGAMFGLLLSLSIQLRHLSKLFKGGIK